MKEIAKLPESNYELVRYHTMDLFEAKMEASSDLLHTIATDLLVPIIRLYDPAVRTKLCDPASPIHRIFTAIHFSLMGRLGHPVIFLEAAQVVASWPTCVYGAIDKEMALPPALAEEDRNALIPPHSDIVDMLRETPYYTLIIIVAASIGDVIKSKS